jgi:hypothetical protein
MYFIVLKGNFPSQTHSRYDNEDECRNEITRLENIRIEKNKQIDEHPATGRGSSFMNMKDNEPWSYVLLKIPIQETPKLDQVLGLHQTIEIYYLVEGYEASLVNEDGKTLKEGHGKTVLEALGNLERALQ